jgi:hypothetical protein
MMNTRFQDFCHFSIRGITNRMHAMYTRITGGGDYICRPIAWLMRVGATAQFLDVSVHDVIS